MAYLIACRGLIVMKLRVTKTAPRLGIESLEPRRLLSANAADSINQFALDVYQHLQREEGNLFYSPMGVSSALAMTYAGAAGQTAEEMRQVLHLGPGAASHSAYRDLLVSQTIRSFQQENFELVQANAIWPDNDLPLETSFIDTVQAQYLGHVQQVDFAQPQLAEDTINSWVADQTEGRITDLVSGTGPSTAMVLTNSVYFTSPWAIPFSPSDTFPESFSTSDGGSVTVPMMYSQPSAARTQIGGFDVLELPFKDGQSSMILAMRLDGGDNHLSTDTLQGIESWIDAPRTFNKIEVKLPRFEATVETGLNTLLMELGMPTAFGGGADFSGITSQPVFIKDVFHKATIDVTEEGVEAAAATEVELFLCFAAGTPVLTPDGPRPIETLGVGDLVLARSENSADGPLEPKRIEQTKNGVANLLEITVHGRVIRTTDLHPFYVHDRGWTPAGKLSVGDWLVTNGPEPVPIDKIEAGAGEQAVYNLRVADHHTYFIGDEYAAGKRASDGEWGFAVWTHNFYGTGYYVDRPFHLMIRDNIASAIAFMGRIDDPTQLDNEVSPNVEYPGAHLGDYNNDGAATDSDRAAWIAAYGRAGANVPGDGNGDGVVNAADYTIWRDRAETPTLALASAPDVVEADVPTEEVRLTRGWRPPTRSAAPRSESFTAPGADRGVELSTNDDALLLLVAAAGPGESVGLDTDEIEQEESPNETLDTGFAEFDDQAIGSLDA